MRSIEDERVPEGVCEHCEGAGGWTTRVDPVSGPEGEDCEVCEGTGQDITMHAADLLSVYMQRNPKARCMISGPGATQVWMMCVTDPVGDTHDGKGETLTAAMEQAVRTLDLRVP